MTDPRNPGPRPTVDEYRTMMRGTHVPDQLKQATLSEAGRRRGRSAKTVRTPVRTGASVRRRSALGFAVAACLVLVAGIGATAFAINGPGGFGPGKTVTFDYDHQESIDDQRIVEIYIGFPLSEEGKEAYELALAGKNSLEASRQLNTAIEKGAAREISTSRLKLTATFADGSMQTKTYRIAPVPDFDERYEAYSDARAAFQSIEPPSRGASQQEIDDYLGKMPQMPKLYTITELNEG